MLVLANAQVGGRFFLLYNPAVKISTKTGDGGFSRLYSGRVLKKSSLVFEVLGDLDELNAAMGLCKSRISDLVGAEGKKEFLKILEILQRDIYRIMAIIGNDMRLPAGIAEIDRKDVLLIEQYIEKFEEEIGELGEFAMPGKNEISARLHFARTVCRRAERKFVAYACERGESDKYVSGGDGEKADSQGKILKFIFQYINRVSDLLFLMAESVAGVFPEDV